MLRMTLLALKQDFFNFFYHEKCGVVVDSYCNNNLTIQKKIIISKINGSFLLRVGFVLQEISICKKWQPEV